MRAAEAIGDDTLQKQTQGRVVPDSFTHGTSAQRMEALQLGCKTRQPGVVQVLEPDQHLADVVAAEQAEERVRHVLEAVDDRLARLDRAARDPAAHLAVELAQARQIVDDDEALRRIRMAMMRMMKRKLSRLGRVIALDHPANGEARIVAGERESGVEMIAADIVEIDVDAVRCCARRGP